MGEDLRISENILEHIGNTPLVKIKKITSPGSAEILAKLELLNPAGSVKDRIAAAMIEDAEKKGILKPGSTIIEPTSGNTGIGLAMVSAVKGYRCVITMPDTMSLERIHILRSYGAEVVLTKGSEGMKGAIKKAEEISRKTRNAYMPQQFKHLANPDIHRKTTAIEILKQTGSKLNAFVAGVGTGGTITGVGEVLKEYDPKIKVIAVEPEGSAVLSGKPAGAHKIQGIGAGFVPDILNRAVIDDIIVVKDQDAYETAKLVAKKEGIFCGFSSGAALWAALKVAKAIGVGKRVVTIFPDTGERYFSMTQYFEF